MSVGRLGRSPKRLRQADPRIVRAVEIIRQRFDEPISLAQLARTLRMSRSHLSRTFHAAVGISFRVFLHERRLARAVELLRNSNRSVTDIAMEAGFYDLPHLDKALHARFGMSPTQFRRKRGRVGQRRASQSARSMRS